MSQSIPRFPLPSTLDEWRRRRRATRRTLWQLLGDLPPRPRSVRTSLLARRTTADYVREDLLLDDGVGEHIPAAVVLPRRSTPPYPAVLYHHSHWGEYEIGLEELFQPWPVRETPATALARRGYAVLCIDARTFGGRQGRGPGGPAEVGRGEELAFSKALLWAGTSLWATMVRDDLIALDYLAARADIDPHRIGATGMSMGSTRTWWLAALDGRVAAAVCVACLTRCQSLLRHRALARHGIYYFVPGFLRHFDTEAVLGLIAPRPLLCLTGARDAGSPADGVRFLHHFCAKMWGLHGRRRLFQGILYPRLGHVYTRAMWQRMVAWFDAHL